MYKTYGTGRHTMLPLECERILPWIIFLFNFLSAIIQYKVLHESMYKALYIELSVWIKSRIWRRIEICQRNGTQIKKEVVMAAKNELTMQISDLTLLVYVQQTECHISQWDF